MASPELEYCINRSKEAQLTVRLRCVGGDEIPIFYPKNVAKEWASERTFLCVVIAG